MSSQVKNCSLGECGNTSYPKDQRHYHHFDYRRVDIHIFTVQHSLQVELIFIQSNATVELFQVSCQGHRTHLEPQEHVEKIKSVDSAFHSQIVKTVATTSIWQHWSLTGTIKYWAATCTDTAG